MKPTNQAWQVFYGTLPLIAVVIGIWLRIEKMREILRELEGPVSPPKGVRQ